MSRDRFRFASMRGDLFFDASVCPMFAVLIGLIIAGAIFQTTGIDPQVAFLALCGEVALVQALWLPRKIMRADLPQRDGTLVLRACLLTPCLAVVCSLWTTRDIALCFSLAYYLGLTLWLYWYLGNRPPIRAEVVCCLATAEAQVAECKAELLKLGPSVPTTARPA
jgi:hypothetical protein